MITPDDLRFPPNLRSECDCCHHVDWLWVDHEQAGEFAYCAPCVRRLSIRDLRRQEVRREQERGLYRAA